MCGKISRTAIRLAVQVCTHREKSWCKSTLFLAGMSHRVTGGSILVPELDRRSSYFILCNSFAFAVIRLYYWNPRPCYPWGPLSITGKLHYEGKDLLVRAVFRRGLIVSNFIRKLRNAFIRIPLMSEYGCYKGQPAH